MSNLLAKVQADADQNGRFWRQFKLLWSGLYLLATALAAVLGWQNESLTANQRQIGLALSLLLIVGHLGFLWLDHRTNEPRTPLKIGLTYMAASIIAWFFLIQISAVYYLVLFGLFSHLYIILPLRYAAAGSLVIVSMMAYNETVGSGQPFSWQVGVIYSLMGIGSILLGSWIGSIIQQSEERRMLLAQLQATQAELVEAERRAGVLAERQRLAHEIHDTLAQGFISIIMHLETAEQALPPDETQAANQIRLAKETARTNLQQARRVVADLRPAPLENQSLPAAISRTVARWSESHNIPTTMQTTGSPLPLHPDLDVTLLRATQEALANVQKHAQARSVAVTLSYMEDRVLLDVQDDGVGINGARPSPYGGGFGLEAMRERVGQLKGQLFVESEPGEGTTLSVSLPLEAGEQPGQPGETGR